MSVCPLAIVGVRCIPYASVSEVTSKPSVPIKLPHGAEREFLIVRKLWSEVTVTGQYVCKEAY